MGRGGLCSKTVSSLVCLSLRSLLRIGTDYILDYRHQEDETVASRGSIATKTAVLKVQSGGDKLRFEVHSTPSRGHSSVQKWYMKGSLMIPVVHKRMWLT